MNNDFIYLDHAAATPVSESVFQAMLPYFSDKFFNPSSPYLPAIDVRHDYEQAKQQIARIIGGKSDEIVITAGATESINLAFSCCNKSAGDEILVGEFEHHAVLTAAEKFGKIKLIKIKKSGEIDLDDLKSKITPQTKIISVMLANNEIGTIQPLAKISEIIKQERNRRLQSDNKTPIIFHSDASQGVGQIDVNVARLGVDLLTLNAGKIYGPKQIGLLWASSHIKLEAQIVGGGQERGLRSGTENVPYAVGFARAMTIAEKHRKSETERLKKLKFTFTKILQENFTTDELLFVGGKKQLNSHLALSFPGLDAERLVFMLEAKKVLVATGSACAANKGSRSKTLAAIGLDESQISGSLRISMGKLNNDQNIERAAKILVDAVKAEQARLQVKS